MVAEWPWLRQNDRGGPINGRLSPRRARLRLFSVDELRARLGRKARTFIEQEHSYPAFKRQLYALYAQLDPRPAN